MKIDTFTSLLCSSYVNVLMGTNNSYHSAMVWHKDKPRLCEVQLGNLLIRVVCSNDDSETARVMVSFASNEVPLIDVTRMEETIGKAFELMKQDSYVPKKHRTLKLERQWVKEYDEHMRIEYEGYRWFAECGMIVFNIQPNPEAKG